MTQSIAKQIDQEYFQQILDADEVDNYYQFTIDERQFAKRLQSLLNEENKSLEFIY